MKQPASLLSLEMLARPTRGFQQSAVLPRPWDLRLYCPFYLERSLSPRQPMWDRDWAFASPGLPFQEQRLPQGPPGQG